MWLLVGELVGEPEEVDWDDGEEERWFRGIAGGGGVRVLVLLALVLAAVRSITGCVGVRFAGGFLTLGAGLVGVDFAGVVFGGFSFLRLAVDPVDVVVLLGEARFLPLVGVSLPFVGVFLPFVGVYSFENTIARSGVFLGVLVITTSGVIFIFLGVTSVPLPSLLTPFVGVV